MKEDKLHWCYTESRLNQIYARTLYVIMNREEFDNVQKHEN